MSPRIAANAGSRLPLVPRVDLIPPEIGERNKALAQRSFLRILLILVAVVVVAASVGTWFLAVSASNALDAEHERTQDLLLERSQHRDVQDAQRRVEVGAAAIRVGGSTEIDWRDYLRQLEDALPDGVRLSQVTIDSSDIQTRYPQSDIPLEGPRIATISFTAVSDELPIIAEWLRTIRELPGFVDALPGTVAVNDGGYAASITMHIDARAYSGRLVPIDDVPADLAGAETDEEAQP